MIRRLILGLVLILVSFPAPLEAQQWTRFRGPNGTGRVDVELPARWTEQDYLWQAALPGVGHSSPVIWGEKVFLLSGDPETATRYVLCLSTADGAILWQREFPSQPHRLHARNSFASTTPAVDQDYLYVAWSTPQETTFLALDHAGQVIWTRDLGPFDSQHGFGTSPIVYGDLVILCHQQKKPQRDGPRTETSSIVAVDRSTGETRWQTKRWSEVASYSVPCIWQQPGEPDQLVCCSTAHGIFSLDPQTGRENWSCDVFTMRTVSSPVIADGLVLGTTGAGEGGNYVVAVQPKPTPTVAYRVERQAPYVPTPIVKGDLVFLWSDKGTVSCVQARDGEVIWTKRVGGNYSGSPVLAGDKLYCISEDGEVVTVAAARQFQLLGKTALGEPSRSTPAVADGRMYLRTYSRLFAVGEDKGAR